MHDDISLPSDHAVLILMCIQPPVANKEWWLGRARGLGDDTMLHTSSNRHLQEPVKFNKIDMENF